MSPFKKKGSWYAGFTPVMIGQSLNKYKKFF